MTAPTMGSVCTGYGGLDLAVSAVLGARPAWVADPDPGAARILAHHWPEVPNLGDITALDWASVPRVDVLTAGFPCQDLSHAGRGAGIRKDTRSGLWLTIAHAVGVLRPRLLLLENVAAIATRRPGLDVVLADLAALGFDAEWTCLRASDVGAPHRRDRWFCLAWPADPDHLRGHRHRTAGQPPQRHPQSADRVAAHRPRLRGGEPAEATHPFPGSGQARPEPGRRSGGAAADPDDAQWNGQQGEQPWRPAPAGGGGSDIDWGAYARAVARWEAVTGPAPRPTDDRGRLSPPFVEWLMGLPPGWVTDVPGLTRTQQLHKLGNGVVPLQAVVGLHTLMPVYARATAALRQEDIAS
ncbi:DNA cytosine methyltransferase [Nonomuraea longicatena]|uniref:DNA (cytosine-5-)-methyltransferase n=1 Tax=Nonomuraea longicatena TaxID=83682 RepID=A0ABP4A710_9ACTN